MYSCHAIVRRRQQINMITRLSKSMHECNNRLHNNACIGVHWGGGAVLVFTSSSGRMISGGSLTSIPDRGVLYLLLLLLLLFLLLVGVPVIKQLRSCAEET